MGILIATAAANARADKTTLNEYLNFSYPVDLRQMVTISDVEVSQSLGTCLVRMGQDGVVVSGIARSWTSDTQGKFIDFNIDPKAKWSDGSAISVADIMTSFRDTKAHFQKSLASLFESYSSMEEISPSVLRIHLHSGVSPVSFLPKLVEPMFGIVKIVNWSASNKITSGPYSVKSADEKDLILEVNPHWLFHSAQMISEIHLRRSANFVTAHTLREDQWPDLVNLIAGLTKKERAELPPEFTTFKRDHDRLLHLRYVGHGNLESVRTLFAYLRAHADFNKIAELFDGGVLANQVMPAGLPLHGKDPAKPSVTADQLKASWKKADIKIAYSVTRMQPEIKEVFEKLLREILPFKIEFFPLSAKDANEVHLTRKYDLAFGSVGVDAENLDGGMSFYIEQQPVYLPSDKTPKGNFVGRLKAIRHSQEDQTAAFRQMLFDAVEGNYFLPIAHFSTTFIGRKGVDFSQVPKSGENFPFSAMRRSE